MKTFSTLALAAVLATGVSGFALSAPAEAQKKGKEEAAAPGFKLSKPVIAAAKPAQDAMTAGDFATAETQVVAVETAATTDDDKYVAAALRYDLTNRKLNAAQTANPKAPIDETVLAKPLDALIAAKSTPAADRAKYLYRRGILAFNSNQYPVATQYFTQAKAAGFNDPNLELQLIKAKIQGGDQAGGLTDLDTMLKAQVAAGQKPSEDYYRYAISRANQAKNVPQTINFLTQYVATYPTAKNWRDVVVTYGLQQNSLVKLDNPQKVDLFRLMRSTGSLADQFDYEEYAQKVYDRGLPGEAQAVIKEGQAAGKIPATSTNSKSILADSATAIRNDGSLSASEAKAKASANGVLASQTGDGYLGQGNYAKAIELYTLALTKGGVNADEVNTHLGIAQARSGDKAAATATFAKVTGQPRAGIAQLWTASLRTPAASATTTASN